MGLALVSVLRVRGYCRELSAIVTTYLWISILRQV